MVFLIPFQKKTLPSIFKIMIFWYFALYRNWLTRLVFGCSNLASSKFGAEELIVDSWPIRLYTGLEQHPWRYPTDTQWHSSNSSDNPACLTTVVSSSSQTLSSWESVVYAYPQHFPICSKLTTTVLPTIILFHLKGSKDGFSKE